MVLEKKEQGQIEYYPAFPVLRGVKRIFFAFGYILLETNRKEHRLPSEFWLQLSEQLPFMKFVSIDSQGNYRSFGKGLNCLQIESQSPSRIFSLQISLETLPEVPLSDPLETFFRAPARLRKAVSDEELY